jgi:serine/threonine protein kinase
MLVTAGVIGGTVLYELFTGRPPFDGTPAKAMHRVLHEEPTPRSAVADVPAALDDVLLTALAKEKADRYESVLYLRDALQNVTVE